MIEPTGRKRQQQQQQKPSKKHMINATDQFTFLFFIDFFFFRIFDKADVFPILKMNHAMDINMIWAHLSVSDLIFGLDDKTKK